MKACITCEAQFGPCEATAGECTASFGRSSPDRNCDELPSLSFGTISGAVNGKVCPVGFAQAGDGRGGIDAQGCMSGGAEVRAEQRLAVIGEADEALVEGGIPEGGEGQASVDVETPLLAANGPWHDVLGSEQRGSVMRSAGRIRPTRS